MPNLKNRFMDQVLRIVRRHLRLEVCAVEKVHYHKEPGDLNFNEVTVIMRDRAQEQDPDKKYIRRKVPVLQNMIGHFGGNNWNPRKGDLVYCFFYHERKGICLGNLWGWHEYPACRPTAYDVAGKGGQWMKPFQDPNTGDFPRQPYPPLEKPYCFPRWFHGPVTGKTGKGRDWQFIFDYCHEGHVDKECTLCKNIDSVGRYQNHGFKFYSSESESTQAHPDRGLYFAPCGSYWMFESKCCEDCESCTELGCCSELFTEGKGFWTIQGVIDGQDYKGHIRHSPTGTIDIHSTSEFAKIADEATGTRAICVSPSDLTVDYAVQLQDFTTKTLREILKNGKIYDYSSSEIKLKCPEIILDGDVLITGSCTHNECSCEHTTAGGKYFARDCMGAGLEGHNSRWRKEEGTFNPTPASTSTITTLIDRTGAISIGTPVRYEIAGVIYYGLVMNVTTTTLTIAGPPLSDDIDDLYFGVSEMVWQADYVIPGEFAAAAEDELIKTFQKSHSVWRGKPAYLVQIGHVVQTLDSTDQPEVTASINSNVVGTDNTNTGKSVALVVQSTTVGINPTNYRIVYGDVIELETTQGGTGDASDLTVFLTFVSE